MAKTIDQKKQEVEEIKKDLDGSNGFLVFGFSGIPVNDLNEFRSKLREAKGDMRIVKRRLLNICLKDKGIDFVPGQFLGQTAFVPFRDDIIDVAGTVYDFIKEDEIDGRILGGYDAESKEVYGAEYLERVGQLPPREILMGQVVGGFSGPIRAFVYTLKAIAEK